MTSDTAPGGVIKAQEVMDSELKDTIQGWGGRKWLFCELKKGEGPSYIRLRLTVILAAAGIQGPQVLQGNENPG